MIFVLGEVLIILKMKKVIVNKAKFMIIVENINSLEKYLFVKKINIIRFIPRHHNSAILKGKIYLFLKTK